MIRASRVYRENNCRLIRRVIRSCGAIKSNDEPIKYLWNRMQARAGARERAFTPLCPPPPVVTRCLPHDNPPRGPRSHKYTYCAVASRSARRDFRRNPLTPHCRTSSLDRDHSGSFFAHCLVQRGPWDHGPRILVAGDVNKLIWSLSNILFSISIIHVRSMPIIYVRSILIIRIRSCIIF